MVSLLRAAMIDAMFDPTQGRMTVNCGDAPSCPTLFDAMFDAAGSGAGVQNAIAKPPAAVQKARMAQLPFDQPFVEAMPTESIEVLIGILAAIQCEIGSVILGAAGFVRSQPEPVSAAQALEVMGGIIGHIFDDIHTHLDALVAQRRAVHAEQGH